MDYLYANMDQSEHINNFNNGNGSSNGTVQNSPGETYLTDKGNGYHTDMIQLMVGSKAENFGYNNSAASKYYWDKYVLIDGDIIDTWAKSAAGGNVGESVSGRAFVGFDFEQFYKDEDVYTGSWTYNGKTYKYVKNAPNAYCGHIKKFDDTNKPETVGTIQQWLDDGYLPVDGAAGKEWAKVEKCADGYFSDWIVCIAPGHKIIEEPYDGRIMAEDLSAVESGDFDFNDVVFDYKLLGNETAEIQLRAAGGTLELYVGGTRSDDWKTITEGYEVHERFEVSVNQMVNTGVTTVQEPDPFVVDCAGNLPVNIKIWVKKNGVFHELTAHTGKPASKFRTACTTKWCDEYISISNPYPLFKNWVDDTDFTEWTTTNFTEIFADKNLSNNEGAIKGRY